MTATTLRAGEESGRLKRRGELEMASALQTDFALLLGAAAALALVGIAILRDFLKL